MSVTIESLEVQIQSNSASATDGIEALMSSLLKLKEAVKGGLGLTGAVNQLRKMDMALKETDSASFSKIDRLAESLSKLASLGKVTISSSIATQLQNIGAATTALTAVDFSNIEKIGTALTPLTGMGKAAGLKSVITQLERLPNLAKTMSGIHWDKFTSQLNKLSASLRPLSMQLNTVAAAFGKLPANITKTVKATNTLSGANSRAAGSYFNLWAKISLAKSAVQGIASQIAAWITESNKYVEDLNLFTASMGGYALEAKRYAEQVGELMGIDPAEFMRNQGVFMTITEGFGVVSDRAAIMSENLTQLGYDLSSFFNISFADSMQKLTSGISGELEPLRRLGYDLSQAKLKAVALSLGITKSFNAMTQAEKAQLRYYTIMTQVTVAQGDMARTLNAPANQLRIFSAQLTQAKRALGNIFVPALIKALPYAIAFAKVIRLVAEQVANLFGFQLPKIDYSGLKSGRKAVESMTDGMDDAAKKAKQLKNAILGIDELNILSKENENPASGIADNLGGNFDFKLPEYNFLEGAVATQVDEIVKKFKEWLGITEDIKTWSDFFHTKLGNILKLAWEIGKGFLAWQFAKGFLDGLAWIRQLKKLKLTEPVLISVSLVVAWTAANIEWDALKDIIVKGVNGLNVGEAVGSSIAFSLAGALAGKTAAPLLAKAGITAAAIEGGLGASLAGALFTGGIAAVVAGLPIFVTGIYSSIKEGINWLSAFLTEFGATLTGVGAGAIGAALGAWGGPIGIAVGALVGVVVGAITNLGILIYQNWDAICDWIGKVVTAVGMFFLKTLPDFIHDFIKFFQILPSKIREGWEAAIKPIRDFDWQQLGYDISYGVVSFVKNICQTIKEFFTKTLPNVWETVKAAFGNFFGRDMPSFFLETIPSFFRTVLDSFVTFFTKTIPDAICDIGKWFVEVGRSMIDGIIEGLNAGVGAVMNFADGLVGGFKDALGIHSPSRVFRDEVGRFMGEGLMEGVKSPLADINRWALDNVVAPIQKTVSDNPIKQGIILGKSGWETVEKWIGSLPALPQKVRLVKSGWETVRSWIGNIPTLDQAISLAKQSWSTVKNWIGFIPVLSQSISLLKKGWTTVKNWIGVIPVLPQGICLIKSGWDSIRSWIGDHIVPAGISLYRDGWSSIGDFVGTRVSVGVSLFKDGWNSIDDFVGKPSAKPSTKRSSKRFAEGGYISGNGKSGFWKSIPKFANGTANAGMHGSLFLAGEAGAEMVGHIGGQTEVLNQSQIKLAMRSAVISGMAQFTGYWRAIHSQITAGSNAIIRSVMVNTEVLNAAIMQAGGYAPAQSIVQTVSDGSQNAYREAHEESMARVMLEFYREYVEPTLKEIASDTKRQADKEEKTVIRIGNRVITEAVETQRRADGFVFVE